MWKFGNYSFSITIFYALQNNSSNNFLTKIDDVRVFNSFYSELFNEILDLVIRPDKEEDSLGMSKDSDGIEFPCSEDFEFYMNISHTVPSDLPGNQTFSTFSDKEDGPTPPISPVPLSFDSVYWIKNRMSRESGYVKMTANTKRKAHQQVKSNVAGSLPRSHSSSSGHTNASSPQSGGCGEKPRDGLVLWRRGWGSRSASYF